MGDWLGQQHFHVRIGVIAEPVIMLPTRAAGQELTTCVGLLLGDRPRRETERTVRRGTRPIWHEHGSSLQGSHPRATWQSVGGAIERKPATPWSTNTEPAITRWT